MKPERAKQILKEVTEGKNYDPKDTPEEARFRKSLAAEVRAISAKGGVCEIPSENP
jgi:hypothetical protein